MFLIRLLERVAPEQLIPGDDARIPDRPRSALVRPTRSIEANECHLLMSNP